LVKTQPPRGKEITASRGAWLAASPPRVSTSRRCLRSQRNRKETHVYIGIGTLIVILIFVLLIAR
jgi:hypothetical protein